MLLACADGHEPEAAAALLVDTTKAADALDAVGDAVFSVDSEERGLRSVAQKLRECAVIVNATPIGTRGRSGDAVASIVPLDRELLRAGQVVYDMVYNPLETPLLKGARMAGAEPVGGLGMLVGQAARAFELWTGRAMPVEAVETKLLDAIRQQQ